MPLETDINSSEIVGPILTKADRCDRCGVDSNGYGISQAYIKAILPKGGELLFCRHHGFENQEALKALNAVIIDDTKFIS